MIQIQCPAKVSLFLDVTGRRRDGGWILAALSAKIALYDVLEFEPHPSFELEVVSETGQEVPSGRDNLVLQAAESFRMAFRTEAGARIRLVKRIPLAAGLGGGASDAAGTLLGLARLYRMERRSGLTAALRRLAVKLGPDVPLFLHRAPFCEGRGMGQRLRPVHVPRTLPDMLLVVPNSPVSGKGIPGDFSPPARKSVLTSLSQLGTLKKKLEKGRPISEWEGLLFNRLEAAVLSGHPEVMQAERILRKLGVRGVLMSGSGSSVFGFVSSEAEGEAALKRLQVYPWKAYHTCLLG